MKININNKPKSYYFQNLSQIYFHIMQYLNRVRFPINLFLSGCLPIYLFYCFFASLCLSLFCGQIFSCCLSRAHINSLNWISRNIQGRIRIHQRYRIWINIVLKTSSWPYLRPAEWVQIASQDNEDNSYKMFKDMNTWSPMTRLLSREKL